MKVAHDYAETSTQKSDYWVIIKREINQSTQWIFLISIIELNLNIIQLFWKHWIQLIQSYNYISQSILSNQCVYVDSSEKRWWQTRNRSTNAVNLLKLIYWVKSQYFLIILKALNSANSELQLSLSKYVE